MLIKKIVSVILSLSLVFMVCGCHSDKDNPLHGKDTDERIVMCLENAYPEHNFKVVKSFDKQRNEGLFEDENGISFKVRGIIELVYIVLQSVVKPGITGFFKIDLHIKCYIYLS